MTCPSGKRRRTHMAAIAAAIRCSRSGVPLRIYRCPDCGWHHLTSRTNRAEETK